MKQFKARILANECLKGNFYKLILQWEGEQPLPGQFLTLRINEHPFPLLRRPFAFSGFDPVQKQASIIYLQRGQATYLLAEKRENERIDCIGPLGNAFPLPAPGRQAFLAAGGIGLGPVLFLARELERQGHPFLFVFGARNGSLIPGGEELARLKPVLCTDDGSCGFKGTVVDYLSTLPSLSAAGTAAGTPAAPPGAAIPSLQAGGIYACGPLPMLKACHELAIARQMDCWVSMEQVMACALGACMGCVIELTTGFARVCKEGPVFAGRSIQWT